MDVSIRNYFANNKPGAVKAFFTAVIYPHGQKIQCCKYFKTDTSEWISFPSYEAKKRKEDGKTDYIPYISYEDKEYADELRAALLFAVKNLPESEKRSPVRKEDPWF